MEKAAAEERFEEAARSRDLLRTIEDYRDRPRAISTSLEDQDVVGLARIADRAAIYVFFMRKGKIRDSEAQAIDAPPDVPDAELVGEFLAGFYRDRDLPPRLLLPAKPAQTTGLQSLLGWAKVRVLVPRTGRNRKLVDLAGRNAESYLRRQAGDLVPLDELRTALKLPALPRTIEGFDISNTGGEQSVGSLVVFRDGRPDKDSYRKFLIRTVKGPNDVASLEEVLTRRYRKVLDEEAPLPDLIMVDGGKPQLGAAEKALAGLGLSQVPLVAIAKREEILYTPALRDGVRLERTSAALKLVQAVRDETHRFAITFHRGRREKRSFESLLDGIPGLGPKKRSTLLARYGSLEAIRNAPPAELGDLVGAATAAKVLERLSQDATA
jgi:excinuclease ABC subunit C